MDSSVADFIRHEVPDWDDDVVSAARFKAFSGQRSDWEPKFIFWRDLILKVARHLGVFVIQVQEVKNKWFARGGLTPLCIDRVLLEMYNNGEILERGDLLDPRSGRLYQLFTKFSQVMSLAKSSKPLELPTDHLILKILLQERADRAIQILSESHWTPSCIVTMKNFRSICKGSDEASMILGYLYGCSKALYLVNKNDHVEGVKISLALERVPSVSALDHDSLHLICTTEKLQQQLSVIDQRCEKLRKSALDLVKSGNKAAALRHVKQLKMTSESRDQWTTYLHRVQEVLDAISNAEATKKVSEAIQIGARAIKENGMSAEEVRMHLQELDDSVANQKQVEAELELTPVHYEVIEDDDILDEFKQLEMELGLDNRSSQDERTETVAEAAAKETDTQEFAGSLSQSLSRLNLEAA
ncbi:hypothetical protein H6P81_004507 [Aristolochia fimbriata]|uniref:Charged multivesicular body protein 7 n=1 Tax=Aristolochia fimbriata TaxID=158543 RepID=A0AAV7FH41_ARIFI|nr:hypothetical protein H6P81_004507 [Aristolochia fimbriata]